MGFTSLLLVFCCFCRSEDFFAIVSWRALIIRSFYRYIKSNYFCKLLLRSLLNKLRAEFLSSNWASLEIIWGGFSGCLAYYLRNFLIPYLLIIALSYISFLSVSFYWSLSSLMRPLSSFTSSTLDSDCSIAAFSSSSSWTIKSAFIPAKYGVVIGGGWAVPLTIEKPLDFLEECFFTIVLLPEFGS